jgi:tRNA (cytidine/uridine-2'-O-)-methyltransferase
MFHIALLEPEIPPNTGNIIRLCVNTGAQLHLIEPLGFVPDDKKLRRAGLDYHEWASVRIHKNFEAFIHFLQPKRLFACSTHAATRYTDVTYEADDAFLFGPETRGIPKTLLATFATEKLLRIPMQAHSRSLNLSNSVAVILYEAWRQQNFVGGF